MNPTPKLEDLLQFPALIPVKAVSHKGVAEEVFRLELVDLTARLVPGFTIELISIRASSSGNYYAATLLATFHTIDQFHALDAALKTHPLVRMVL
ncbi:MAG: hypothetical protein H6R07_1530 [Proteobacteria bacterium]|nr:hypothetical protein [Pseudomonadota bacterium]